MYDVMNYYQNMGVISLVCTNYENSEKLSISKNFMRYTCISSN